MTIQEALKSGKMFSRRDLRPRQGFHGCPNGGAFYLPAIPGRFYSFSVEDIIADDWILKENHDDCKDEKKCI